MDRSPLRLSTVIAVVLVALAFGLLAAAVSAGGAGRPPHGQELHVHVR